MELLKELYLMNHECRERVAQLFTAIALDPKHVYSRQRHRYAAQLCRRLGIAPAAEVFWISRILAGFLSLFKRLWHARS